MNWRRGLFRLWLLLSLCWIVPIVVLEWRDLGSHAMTNDLTKWSDEALLKAKRRNPFRCRTTRLTGRAASLLEA